MYLDVGFQIEMRTYLRYILKLWSHIDAVYHIDRLVLKPTHAQFGSLGWWQQRSKPSLDELQILSHPCTCWSRPIYLQSTPYGPSLGEDGVV